MRTVGSIVATAPAIELIIHRRARHGTVAFRESGGPCVELKLTEAKLPRRPNDLQIGEIGGVPFLIDADEYERLGRPDFVVDLAPGSGERLSLKVCVAADVSG